MFRTYFRQCRVVKYSCQPQVYGRLNIAAGVLFVAFSVATLFAKNPDKLVATVILGLCSAGLFGYSAYCFRFRRRPFRRQIVLGSWYNRLYLRNKWLFLLAGICVNLLSYLVGMVIITLLFDGTDAMLDMLMEKIRGWIVLLVIFLLHTFREFFGFYQYYRSPEYRRATAINTGAANG